MRNLRPNTFLLVALLVAAVGFHGRAGWIGETAATAPSGAARTEAAPQGVATLSKPAASVQPTPVGEVAVTDTPVHDLSADANVLVATMCDLQLLAAGTDLELDSGQWSALAEVVVRTQAIRRTYEAKIARVEMIAPECYRAEIPVYAQVGEALREQFTSELRDELGAPMADEVLTKLGDRLEGRFAGFGLGVQILDITGDPTGDLREVRIARTAAYWNSGNARGDLSYRREMHFPAWEDPTGDSWGMWLAILGVTRGES